MRKKQSSSSSIEHKLAPRHGRFGWAWLLLWLLVGFTLEMLHGFKANAYLLDPIRREFWTLAHFHGVALALVNLIYVRWAEGNQLPTGQRNLASWALMAGSVLMPLGFFSRWVGSLRGRPWSGHLPGPARRAAYLAHRLPANDCRLASRTVMKMPPARSGL